MTVITAAITVWQILPVISKNGNFPSQSASPIQRKYPTFLVPIVADHPQDTWVLEGINGPPPQH
jgi:hypothetical protein